MSAAHTPGPWVIDREELEARGIAVTACGSFIADVGPLGSPDAEDEANAALILSAPDLLEALRLALEYWEHRQRRYKNRAPTWVAAALNAIEKSKGGEK